MLGFANLAVFGLLIMIVIIALAIDDKQHRRQATQSFMEFKIDIQRILQEEVVDGLVNMEISVCEALGYGMGGSPYDFVVEDMNLREAKWFTEAIYSYLHSHGLEAKITYKEGEDNGS